MSLASSYTQKPGAIPAYFEAILGAEAPERFTYRFLEKLEFKSTNDRLFVGILKDLGFLDADGVPQDRYYEFLDRTQSAKVLAKAIREAYSDLFEVNREAFKMDTGEVQNKLRTLFAGAKKDTIIAKIAKTFVALCEYADFTMPAKKQEATTSGVLPTSQEKPPQRDLAQNSVSLDSLQYHINIVLPESKDPAIYDAIFKSLRDHLGTRHE
ncbi:MAG: DUF5343 domain-containing protein [Deferribacteres bacterium]|nr:DUF5343 domain-containing protein [candidate division KSB1 bacterium]MCB9511444.1 DUF5343 domain-containing protein [Deferribacteres bacterium]